MWNKLICGCFGHRYVDSKDIRIGLVCRRCRRPFRSWVPWGMREKF